MTRGDRKHIRSAVFFVLFYGTLSTFSIGRALAAFWLTMQSLRVVFQWVGYRAGWTERGIARIAADDPDDYRVDVDQDWIDGIAQRQGAETPVAVYLHPAPLAVEILDDRTPGVTLLASSEFADALGGDRTFLTEAEVVAMLEHEFTHTVHGDNSEKATTALVGHLSQRGVLAWTLLLSDLALPIAALASFFYSLLCAALIAARSRHLERRCDAAVTDQFALRTALTTLYALAVQKVSPEAPASPEPRLFASHPPLDERGRPAPAVVPPGVDLGAVAPLDGLGEVA